MSTNFDDREFDLSGLNLDDLDVRELEFRLELGIDLVSSGGGPWNPSPSPSPSPSPQSINYGDCIDCTVPSYGW